MLRIFRAGTVSEGTLAFGPSRIEPADSVDVVVVGGIVADVASARGAGSCCDRSEDSPPLSGGVLFFLLAYLPPYEVPRSLPGVPSSVAAAASRAQGDDPRI